MEDDKALQLILHHILRWQLGGIAMWRALSCSARGQSVADLADLWVR